MENSCRLQNRTLGAPSRQVSTKVISCTESVRCEDLFCNKINCVCPKNYFRLQKKHEIKFTSNRFSRGYKKVANWLPCSSCFRSRPIPRVSSLDLCTLLIHPGKCYITLPAPSIQRPEISLFDALNMIAYIHIHTCTYTTYGVMVYCRTVLDCIWSCHIMMTRHQFSPILLPQ